MIDMEVTPKLGNVVLPCWPHSAKCKERDKNSRLRDMILIHVTTFQARITSLKVSCGDGAASTCVGFHLVRRSPRAYVSYRYRTLNQ